jgi:hypothetical protein
MSKRFALCVKVGMMSLALRACGDDEEGDGGAGCAHVQMLCESDPDAMIECSEWDSAPASVKECASNATTCDAVWVCVTGG